MPYSSSYAQSAYRSRTLQPRGSQRAARNQGATSPEKRAALARIDLHYGQSQVWKARQQGYRILSMFAGTGGGKTWFGPRFFYPIIRDHPDASYLFVEPTWRMLKRVMLPVVLEFFGAFNLGEMHLGDMVYELRGGGRILFGSVDNPNSLQGVHITGGIWADEIGMYAEDAWDVLLQRGAMHRVPMLNTSTPYTLPWVERRLYKPSLPGHPDADEYWSIQFPSWWNPGYPVEQFWKLKRTWPADKFNRLMLGQFTRIGGLVYDEFDESRNLAEIYAFGSERQIWFRHPIYAPEGEVIDVVDAWCAQDWGWTDPACQGLFVSDAYGRVFLIEEDYDSQVPTHSSDPTEDTWAGRGIARLERWGISGIYCDPESAGDIAAFRSLGLPAVKAMNRQKPGFDAVNTALRKQAGTYTARSGRVLPLGSGLFIGHACAHTIRQIGQYVRQKQSNGDGYLDKPANGQEDHAMDCLRYGVVRDASFDTGDYPGIEPIMLSARRRENGDQPRRRR